MLLSDIKTTTIIVPANEQEYTDVMTLLEFGGYKPFFVSQKQFHLYPLVVAICETREFTSTRREFISDDNFPKIPAHQFIKSNTIS